MLVWLKNIGKRFLWMTPLKNICIFCYGPKINILTKEQEAFLGLICKEEYFIKNFYFTGGTPLSAFYLFHRLSEDIDLFLKKKLIFFRLEHLSVQHKRN